MADRRQLMLYPLVKEGALQPGLRKLSCSVGGHEYFADLTETGEIVFEGRVFRSPSAFSVYVKRKVNPSRKADDGWTSVKYGSNLLSHYRGVLNELTGGAVSGASQGTHSAPPRTAGAARRRRRRSPHSYAEDSVSETDEELYSDLRGEYTDEYESAGDASNPLADPSYEPLGNDSSEPPRKLLGIPGRATRGRAQVCDRHKDAMGEAVPEEFTFVQCSQCKKWRRLKVPAVAMADWECSANPNPMYGSCAIAQEAPDEAIDTMLQEQAQRLHMAKCTRPSLTACSEREFEADLYAFLEQRGEEALATKLRNKQITCNNLPLDIFGLYREVVGVGGFTCNERYDDTNRWKGGINFAGEVFPKLRNWTANNRATSVGNQLHTNYRKFLLAYELAHRSVDLGVGMGPQMPLPTGKVPGGGADALAFLADVAATSKDDAVPVDHGKIKTRVTPPRQASKRSAPADTDPDFESPAPVRKRRTRDSNARGELGEAQPMEVAAALRGIEAESPIGRSAPGTLLLAADAADPNRHWAVLIVALHDLPSVVLAGSTCGPRSEAGSFPQTLQEASPSLRVEDAYPVVVMGTRMMGWAERGACRLYTPDNGEAAMAYLAPSIPLGDADSSTRLGSTAFKALKLAGQFTRTDSFGLAMGRGQGQAAGCCEVGEALADLEARLPPNSSVVCASWYFWQEWRDTVLSACTAAKLAPQVLLLAYQLHPSVLKRGAQHQTLLDELRAVLEMGPSLQSHPADPSGGLRDPAGGLRGSSVGPTVLGISDAISMLHNVIDWSRLRRNPTGMTNTTLAAQNTNNRNHSRTNLKVEADDQDAPKQTGPLSIPNALVNPLSHLPPKGGSNGSGISASHPSGQWGTTSAHAGRPSRLRSATPPIPKSLQEGLVRNGSHASHRQAQPGASHAAEQAMADYENLSATAEGTKNLGQPGVMIAAATDSDEHPGDRDHGGNLIEQANEDLSTGSVDTQGSRPTKGHTSPETKLVAVQHGNPGGTGTATTQHPDGTGCTDWQGSANTCAVVWNTHHLAVRRLQVLLLAYLHPSVLKRGAQHQTLLDKLRALLEMDICCSRTVQIPLGLCGFPRWHSGTPL
ncbi:hypothetical protein WJX73_001287 [Symbiochloris irregularis]|uniref:ARID domain-containing protein n=1 Tax=Symbiochloris irregularis TaxID=706552 RepID=A0AAW1NHV9_9CHLO